MRDEYASIYLQLITDYVQLSIEPSFKQPPTSSAEFVAYTVFRTVWELGLQSRVRPDGLHFLVVNFHQMIVVPQLMRESEARQDEPHAVTFPDPSQALNEAVTKDVLTILSAAADDSNNGEISGHAILKAVARQYKKLRTTRLEIWG